MHQSEGLLNSEINLLSIIVSPVEKFNFANVNLKLTETFIGGLLVTGYSYLKLIFY